MSKKLLISGIILLLTACVVDKPYRPCPYATISRENAKLIQKVNYQDDFMVELKGFEGYCYMDSRVKRAKAVITPVFEITKLRDTDETDVQFSWFTETLKGPPSYLGKRTYFTGTHIKMGERVKEFKGTPVEVKVPNEMMDDFEIALGVDASREEKKYNQRIFDVEYDYYEYPPEIQAPVVKLKVYPEVFDENNEPIDPKYGYPARHLQPQSAPARPVQAQPASGCNSCSLK